MTSDLASAARLLEVRAINVSYGNIAAVRNLSLSVPEGAIVTLVGSNGAGKSTTLRTISGLLHAKSGSIIFNGEDISRTPGHENVMKGIAHSPEGRRIFPRMTVDENLDLGAYTRDDKDAIAADRASLLKLFPGSRNA